MSDVVYGYISKATEMVDNIADCWWSSHNRIQLLERIIEHCKDKIEQIKRQQLDNIMRGAR